MDAIRKQASKLREQVARQQQAVLKQFGGGGYGGSDNVATNGMELQLHQKLEKLYISTRAGKHYQRDIVRGVEGYIVTGSKQVEIGTKLSEDSRKYGAENTCTSGNTLSRAALSFAQARAQTEKERGNLLKALGTQVAEPLRAMVVGAPLEDARHLAQRYDRIRQEAEAQAIEVSKRQAKVREMPPSAENSMKLEAAEGKLQDLKTNMTTLGKEAAAALAAVEAQQQRLTLQRLIAMVEAERAYHQIILQILDQLEGEMISEQRRIETPPIPSLDNSMPPPPSYEEVNGVYASQAHNGIVNCRRLPSGCVVQDMPNGYSKVTWVEHAEYDESQVHQLYRPLLSSGTGFGAQRWVATLQRQCECLAILMSSAVPSREHSAISSGGRRSMLKLAQRMTNNFCAGVCASTVHKWNKLNAGNVGEDVRVMTRKSVDDPGEPQGIVLSAATSVWLPVSAQRLFDFLRDERLRSEWDILSNGGPMQEMAHIAKGQDHANCVSLLRASAMNANQSSMLILQETCTDASGSLVVYAPVDIPAMHVVMNGGDSAYVALLPSGFAIVPDGSVSGGEHGGASQKRASGCLLTVAFQILVNSLPTAKLTVESVETVNNLISCTVQKIKAALHSES